MPFGWPFVRKSSDDRSPDDDEQNSDTKNTSKEIDKRMKREKQASKRTVSLLLLGAGGCGKSTVYKQMQNMYDGGTPEQEMIITTAMVRKQILDDIADLARYNIEFQVSKKACRIEDEKCCEIRDKLAALVGKTEALALTADLAEDIHNLWNQDAMKETFNLRSKSHVMDNTPYFFDRVLEIASPKYEANFEDHVRVRRRTTGIIHATFETQFHNQKWIINVTDVGGQRNERKKWIQVFADVTAVIYVMSLNGYDKVLFEDNTKNVWDETFQLFHDLTSLRQFKQTDFIVFLNKLDLFEKLIRDVPFSVYDSECSSENAHNASYAIKFAQGELTQRFSQASDRPKEKFSSTNISLSNKDSDTTEPQRSLHFHITCATDRGQIEAVLKVIQFETVKSHLHKAALI